MKIKKLDHIGIRVMQFERSIEFYKQLEFSVVRKDLEEHIVVMKHFSGVEINLLDSGDDENHHKNILMDEKEKFPGYTHYAIEVDSVVGAKFFLESLGLTITEGPVTFGDGKSSVFVRDPDENVIEFTQLP